MESKFCVITGAGGLVGSACVEYFSPKFDKIIGIDNNSRGGFFGTGSSVSPMIKLLEEKFPNFRNIDADISNRYQMETIFYHGKDKIDLVIHCAAQPSHDWAATNPHVDFEVNARGTLNILEAMKQYSPQSTFIFTSTNKVYGDRPNCIGFSEDDTKFFCNALPNGVTETMSIDDCLHSFFGVSKVYADLITQEYGKNLGLKTGVFRGGCLTGENHMGAELHGFLNYLVKCAVTGDHYNIYGNGKQVRDNIHSSDLVRIFDEFYQAPRRGVVYNIGGGRNNAISVLEAIAEVNKLRLEDGLPEWTNYTVNPDKWRVGDHRWYITDLSRVMHDYPNWGGPKVTVKEIIKRIYEHYKNQKNESNTKRTEEKFS